MMMISSQRAGGQQLDDFNQGQSYLKKVLFATRTSLRNLEIAAWMNES